MSFVSSSRRAAPVPKPECCSEVGKRVLSRSLRDITSPQPLMFKSDYECEPSVSRPGLDYREAGGFWWSGFGHRRMAGSAPTSRSEHMGRRL